MAQLYPRALGSLSVTTWRYYLPPPHGKIPTVLAGPREIASVRTSQKTHPVTLSISCIHLLPRNMLVY
jgi:hypothetical protein